MALESTVPALPGALESLLLFASGLVAGVVNSVAGAGSMITLPALMIVGGLPAGAANATNRVAVLVQSLSAAESFRRSKVTGLRAGAVLAVPAAVGSLGGAWLATILSDDVLRRVMGVVFLAMLVPVLRPPRKPADERSRSSPGAGIRATTSMAVSFFVLGIYGGFIQVGIGILILAVFSSLGTSLLEGNQVKVVTVAALTAVALAIFASQGLVAWRLGLVVAAGSAIGGWLGAKLSVARGERFIRAFVVVAAVASSLQLFGIV